MNYEKQLKSGFLKAKKITKKFAKTFYISSIFLSKEERLAAYAVYTICRISDETVDTQNPKINRNKTLNNVKKYIEDAYSKKTLNNDLLLAFRYTVNKYNIPKEYFDELLSGMYMDMTKTRYENFDELYQYCYKVAGVVGLIMLKILGAKDDSAKDYAVKLGIAMQLTNILRDIKEDYLRQRIYLPLEDLERFKLCESDIASEKISENFKRLIDYEIARCYKYYHEAEKGIQLISGIRERFVVIAMKKIYSAILEQIKINSYDVFSKRISVSKIKKIITLIKIILKGDYL